MHDKVFSCTIDGLTPKIIEVETDIQNGLPYFSIVGLGDASVQEAKERVRSALKNSRVKFPPLRKTVNLAPAQIRKYGPVFDLAIATSILAASDQIPKQGLAEALFLGELALDGTLRKIKGTLPIVAYASKKGFKRIYLPVQNAEEGGFIPDIEIMPVKNLRELICHFQANGKILPHKHTGIPVQKEEPQIYDFKFIKGMEREKRAMEIAATGNHHVLMHGPPGSGKTVLARTFQTILPALSEQEALEVTSIYSIAGLLPPHRSLITKRPFREVHPSATVSAILGGGVPIKSGEITLGHKGAVFFDELSEFPTKILETLRKPLEDHTITIQRTAQKLTFPAEFIFVGAMNPCPCGFYGDPYKECSCSMSQITKHRKKLSGPFLDRIDIVMPMQRMKFEKFSAVANPENSNTIKVRVQKATEIQWNRQQKPNSKLKSQEIKKYCCLETESKALLKDAIYKLNISTRGILQILKIARTIADLANSKNVRLEHVTESLQYRDFTLRR